VGAVCQAKHTLGRPSKELLLLLLVATCSSPRTKTFDHLNVQRLTRYHTQRLAALSYTVTPTKSAA
jgi:hypothetical protein